MAKTLEWSKWEEIYCPLKDEYESLIDFDPKCGQISAEEFSSKIKEKKVWTAIDCPEANEGILILTGFRRVNRMAHYITVKPYSEEIEVE